MNPDDHRQRLRSVFRYEQIEHLTRMTTIDVGEIAVRLDASRHHGRWRRGLLLRESKNGPNEQRQPEPHEAEMLSSSFHFRNYSRISRLNVALRVSAGILTGVASPIPLLTQRATTANLQAGTTRFIVSFPTLPPRAATPLPTPDRMSPCHASL